MHDGKYNGQMLTEASLILRTKWFRRSEEWRRVEGQGVLW